MHSIYLAYLIRAPKKIFPTTFHHLPINGLKSVTRSTCTYGQVEINLRCSTVWRNVARSYQRRNFRNTSVGTTTHWVSPIDNRSVRYRKKMAEVTSADMLSILKFRLIQMFWCYCFKSNQLEYSRMELISLQLANKLLEIYQLFTSAQLDYMFRLLFRRTWGWLNNSRIM